MRRSTRKLRDSLSADGAVQGSSAIEGRIGMLEERIMRADEVIDALLTHSTDLHAVVAFVTFEEEEGE